MPADTWRGPIYCVGCKTRHEAEGRVEVTANGRRMVKADCPACGRRTSRILGAA
ncbi:DUF5679 domain-containing protein [Phycicoccus flavus]|uniref:DUF5679 domain-containing protein n=1 Tax=Phycicoccus flavus TaxID=2502783 RepID=A0A8T6QYH2_9MICO|nr:DUF5679 domain-containing protein [Phycicoccus flavus]NHA66908.1 hypothetical protein [Phycicoccus flavus]